MRPFPKLSPDFLITLFLSLCLWFIPLTAKAGQELNNATFAKIPILHDGRIKPIDSFARHHLKLFTGKDHLKDKTATQWLSDVVFKDKDTLDTPLFRIKNPDLINSLNLPHRKDGLYSFAETFSAFVDHMEGLEKLYTLPEEQLSRSQHQMLMLHTKVTLYMNLISTFDPTTPATLFRIIPPQWNAGAEKAAPNDNWYSPWEMVQQGQGSPISSQYLGLWQRAINAHTSQDQSLWDQASTDIFTYITEHTANLTSPFLLDLEVTLNKINPFGKSLILYIIALISLIVYALYPNNKYKPCIYATAGFGVLGGFAFTLLGLTMRMIIMGRPPVTTLYESILFVGLICVLFAILLERRRFDGIGLLIGAVSGALLQFIGLKYALDGDTMGMLVAVLDTNFWLATHVVTITIGYGCALVAGIMAHIYLFKRLRSPDDTAFLTQIDRQTKAIALIALFFSTLGTILGGIWADQSWGRFWGWDPKENGALLIVLWLIWLLHSRIAGQLKPLAFMTGMAMTTIIVAVAWFGVNLLNIGLHSYGFTEHIAMNLALFCGIEFILPLTLCLIIYKCEKARS